MKPTAQTCSTTSSNQNPRIRPLSATTRTNKGSDNFSTCRRSFPRCESYTGNKRYIDNLLARWSAKLENFGRRSPSNMPTRADWISGIGSTRRCKPSHTIHTPKLLMMSWWCPFVHVSDMQACYVISYASPNPSQRHIIRWHQRLYRPIRDPTQTPGTNPDCVDHWLTQTVDFWLAVDFDPFEFDFFIDFWPKVKISKMT